MCVYIFCGGFVVGCCFHIKKNVPICAKCTFHSSVRAVAEVPVTGWGENSLRGERLLGQKGPRKEKNQEKLNRRTYRSSCHEQIKGMRGALARVLGDGQEGTGDNPMSQEDLASVVAQLRQARSLLREQDAIIFAAIFDKCVFLRIIQ